MVSISVLLMAWWLNVARTSTGSDINQFLRKALGNCTIKLSGYKKCTGMVKLPWQPLIDFWVHPSNVCLWLVAAHDGSHPTVERVVSRFRVYVTRHAILETDFHPTYGFKQKGKVERVQFLLLKLVRWKELLSKLILLWGSLTYFLIYSEAVNNYCCWAVLLSFQKWIFLSLCTAISIYYNIVDSFHWHHAFIGVWKSDEKNSYASMNWVIIGPIDNK